MAQKGFSPIGIILVVAMVVLLGFVGWRVWEAKKEKPAEQNTEQQNQQANEQKTEELNPDGYLHIRELGVKIKLTEGIRDAVYSYNNQLNTENPEYWEVRIYTKSIAEKSDGDCDPTKSSSAPFGYMTKTTKNESALGTILTPNGNTVLQLPDNSFIYRNGPQSPCSSSVEVEEFVANQRSEFVEAFKSTELDQ